MALTDNEKRYFEAKKRLEWFEQQQRRLMDQLQRVAERLVNRDPNQAVIRMGRYSQLDMFGTVAYMMVTIPRTTADLTDQYADRLYATEQFKQQHEEEILYLKELYKRLEEVVRRTKGFQAAFTRAEKSRWEL